MSHLSYSIPSVPLRLARVLVGLPLLLGLSAGVAQAQGGSDPSGDHAGPPHHHNMQRSAALDGPPAPAVVRDSIQLSGKALQQYTQRYESHMASTKASRDSLRASMQAARAAFEKGRPFGGSIPARRAGEAMETVGRPGQEVRGRSQGHPDERPANPLPAAPG